LDFVTPLIVTCENNIFGKSNNKKRNDFINY